MVGDQERAAGLEVPVGAPQRLSVVVTPATHVDRPICPREVELVHRLHGEPGREAVLRRLRLSRGDHIGRDVGTIDVEAVGEQRHQDPPRPAPKVERRLPEPADCCSEVGPLLGLGHIELGPPARDQAVMPGLGLGNHRRRIRPITPSTRARQPHPETRRFSNTMTSWSSRLQRRVS